MTKGYDVSHYQTGSLPADAEFAFIKATEGTTIADEMYATHLADARSRGLPLGHYHYVDGAAWQAEADWFLTHSDLRPGEAVALDAEGTFINTVSSVAWSGAWLDYVTAKTGAVGLLYSSDSTFDRYDWTPVTGRYGAWVARYGPHPTHPYTIWQYTDAPIDTDTTDLTQDQLRAMFAPKPTITNHIPEGVDMLVVFQAMYGCWWIIPADLSKKSFLHPNDKAGYEQLAKAAGVNLGEGAMSDDTLNRIPDVSGAAPVSVVAVPKQ